MILDANDPLNTLESLSQDFPKYAHHLSEVTVEDKYHKAWDFLRGTSLAEAFFINGYRISPRDVESFK